MGVPFEVGARSASAELLANEEVEEREKEEVARKMSMLENEDSDAEEDDFYTEEDSFDGVPPRKETMTQFCDRQLKNVVHFLVEDWFLSAILGVITAVLSIFMDVIIEYLQHYRVALYEMASEHHIYSGFAVWVLYMVVLIAGASMFCHSFGKQAVGSGIPEIKVIMHGFTLKGYLTFRTLIAKIVGLTLTLGGGLPVGKEGPFVHIGAIVASLLNKATSACQYNSFFSNEGRQMEMLSSGCAVGIACTFSAPAGGVLYGIESTSKYFAVKNYWRSFFATTCSALIFRFAINLIIPQHIAGTITAYYQTNFPNEVFLIEEIPLFLFIGLMCGLFGALFIWLHRTLAIFKKKNRAFRAVFGTNPISFTLFFTIVVAVITFPGGIGQFIAGKYTFRETLADFLANCTYTLVNQSHMGCPQELVDHWTPDIAGFHPLMSLAFYLVVYFVLVSICVSLYIPSGIFVPCFVIGAAFGRLVGEVMTLWFPEGIRGPDGPQIYPGLYAVVGAAAYTGAVTHSLSIALIVCETTGQLCALLPVLLALMVGNAIASFLQPSIYESIIKINNYPYLADLPPSRISVHTMKIDKVMVRDIVYITRETTYRELRDILAETPHLRSYPYVNDKNNMTLLGSVARKYLCYLLLRKLGPEPSIAANGKRRSRTASEILSTLNSLRRNSNVNLNALNGAPLTDRNISGNTLLAHSPLHDNQGERSHLAPLLYAQNDPVEHANSISQRAAILASKIDLEDAAIDAAPFQLVKGTSLYKVHTMFSLLALNHAYVTEKGRLVGVVALKELREALNNIYSRGAVVPKRKRAISAQVLAQMNSALAGPAAFAGGFNTQALNGPSQEAQTHTRVPIDDSTASSQ